MPTVQKTYAVWNFWYNISLISPTAIARLSATFPLRILSVTAFVYQICDQSPTEGRSIVARAWEQERHYRATFPLRMNRCKSYHIK